MSARRAARLSGLGAHRPARVVGNDEVAAMCGSSADWIRDRTGIASRRWASAEETVVAMGESAAGKALADAGVDPADVGLVLLATCTMPRSIPGGAPELASRLGATHAGAADVNAGCAGFVYALAQAADAVRAGSADHVLVVGSERLTDVVDPTERTTAPLFGDGAGAVVVSATEVAAGDRDPIARVVWAHDGAQRDLLRTEGSPARLRMEGQSVYRWATGSLPALVGAACAAAGLTPDQLGAFVPHQANRRITDAVARALALPDHVVVADDVTGSGNTSSASVPLALEALRAAGRVRRGAPALLAGFGAGLTAAALVADVP